MCTVQFWYKECLCSGDRNVRPIEKSFAQQEKKIEGTLVTTQRVEGKTTMSDDFEHRGEDEMEPTSSVTFSMSLRFM